VGAALTRRTYWHLEGRSKKPSEYEIATSRLLYHPERGFEVAVPFAKWWEEHHASIRCADWERFADPAETTYTRYVRTRREREIYCMGLLDRVEHDASDAHVDHERVALLDRVFAPLRYPCHGLSMATAYLGQLAPSGRIAAVCAFSVGDETRRVQRIAYRVRLFARAHTGFGDRSRATWEDDEVFQPLRRAIETLLTTYGWGEAFTALTLAIKPALDELINLHIGRALPELEPLLASFHDDARWHRDWAIALARLIVAEPGENAARIAEWRERWRPIAQAAVAPIAHAVGAELALGPIFTELDRRIGR
jgi:toluene monooxygenase system protein E